MRKFVVEIKNQKIWFKDSDLKHLQVLRIKENQTIMCVDQFGNDLSVLIQQLKPIKAKIVEIKKSCKNSESYNIDCFLGVIKKHNFELAIQKLNELNIHQVIPVYFQFSQMNVHFNHKRLLKIISESQKQCNRKHPLLLADPISFKEMVNLLNNYQYNFLAYEIQSKSEWNKIKQVKINSNHKIAYIIGPEGGFSNKEILELKNKCIFLKLTNTILRSETAAIFLASILIERFFYEK